MKALLTVSSILLSAGIALGQQPTSPPSNAAQNSNGVPSFWKPYSTIHVFIDGTKFPPGSALESAVKQGFTEIRTDSAIKELLTYLALYKALLT